MRRLLVLCCLLTAVLAVRAADNTTLCLSRSMLAIKIVDPVKQITTFAPLLDMLEALGTVPGQPPNMPDVPTLRTNIGNLAKIPGIEVKGACWLVTMPCREAANPTPAAATLPVAGKAPAPQPNTYLLLTLANPAQFSEFVKATPDISGITCGKVGVVAFTKATPLDYTAVDFDLPLLTKREVVLSMQPENLCQALIAGNAQPQVPSMVGPIMTFIKAQQQNIRRVEIGLAMTANNLSGEFFIVPVADSPLAKGLARPEDNAMAFTYAGYLPPNLGYCGVGNYTLPGMNGIANNLLRISSGFLGLFMPEDRNEKFNTSLDALMTLCSQGRAMGITAPPLNGKMGSTLVAIYHVPGEEPARNVVRGFMQELRNLYAEIGNGELAQIFSFTFKADAEQITDLPIDLVKFKLNVKTQPKNGTPPANVVIDSECRIAYLGDKMLVTIGPESAVQMTAVIKRVRGGADGFAGTESFKTIKGVLPENARSFESFATLDLVRAGLNIVLPEAQKSAALRWLSIFPPQHTPITIYIENKDGTLRGEGRLPGEQLGFLFSVLKMAKESQANKAAAPVK